ncbi:FUSC family protein [uncultured Clostridium sp.]|uniref:FUSC family protein n=1 Tax=uncultured Clostridium sp. TaxID=59620 RepID=UPI00260E65A1|nr:FUSC family protein [uncultured Clostridium sp.]
MTKSLALKGWILGVIAILTFLPFGMSNIMVAMASILLIPELAKEDYTVDKWKEFLKIIITCTILSFFASTFTFNIYIGSIATFIIAFYIYYKYTYEDRESQSMIFMIYYILILSIPMPKGELTLRMGATIYGAALAMALYLLVFKLDFIKLGNIKIEKSREYLNKAIENKLKNKNSDEEFMLALKEIQDGEDMLIKKSEKARCDKFKIGEKIITIDLIKSIGWTLYKTNNMDILEKIIKIIEDCYKFYNGESNIEELKGKFSKVFLELKEENNMNLIKSVFDEFCIVYKELNKEKGYEELLEKKREILKKYSREFNLNYKLKFSMKSIKFNTAIKGAIINTIAVFIVFYFNIPEGRWILYTITVVYLPFAEQSVKKLMQRVFGTAIGFIVFDILLSISQNTIYVCVLVLISLYFSIYMIDYGKRAIFITYTGIASQFIMYKHQNYYMLSFYRIGYVILGAIIAFLVIKYIYPINFKNSIKDIFYKYKSLNINILENLNWGKDVEMSYEDIIIVNRYMYIKSSFINKYAKNELLTKVMRYESYIVGEYKNISRLKEKFNVEDESIVLKDIVNTFLELEDEIN